MKKQHGVKVVGQGSAYNNNNPKLFSCKHMFSIGAGVLQVDNVQQ